VVNVESGVGVKLLAKHPAIAFAACWDVEALTSRAIGPKKVTVGPGGPMPASPRSAMAADLNRYAFASIPPDPAIDRVLTTPGPPTMLTTTFPKNDGCLFETLVNVAPGPRDRVLSSTAGDADARDGQSEREQRCVTLQLHDAKAIRRRPKNQVSCLCSGPRPHRQAKVETCLAGVPD
jgi:hypothetical protein